MVIGATGVAVIAVGFVSYRKVTGENEQYQLGLRYMKAADFSAAASELRLCLQDEPTHSRAKGILAYSVLRVEFDETIPQNQAEAKLLNEFNRYFSILSLQDRLSKMRDGDGKKALVEVLKSTEDQLKEQFRKKRVPFRDWVDFKASIAAATPVIFETKFQPDDLPGVASRDVAAALLVRAGADAKATEYLMERCAESSCNESYTCGRRAIQESP